ncbi:enhanced serine sensitivity protein SseB [Streptomyces sp. NPDC002644]
MNFATDDQTLRGGWPGNELEEVLAASAAAPGSESAGGRVLEVLTRSHVWIPLPAGGDRDSRTLDLPTVELGGQTFVPVFSSQEQLRRVAGPHMSFSVAPVVEFARGLPPEVGVVVNPDGAVGLPLTPAAVAELCRAAGPEGAGRGGRVRLWEPDWREDPVDFLRAASEEFAAVGVVATARRCLAAVETAEPAMFVGVELATWDAPSGDARALPLEALGRALGRHPVRWPVNLVLLDAVPDPVCDYLRAKVPPFYGAV